MGRYVGGDFEFIGRVDHQVKLRGYRVELQEIELVLMSHPNVSQAVAVSSRVSHGALAHDTLITFILPRNAGDSAEGLRSELWALLKKRLPPYMLPMELVIVDHIPLSSNKKIDRKALMALQKK